MRAVFQALGTGHRRPAAAIVVVCLVGVIRLGGAPLALAEADSVRIGGRLDSYGIVAFDRGSPSQDPLARLDLSASQRLTPSLTWRLSLTGRWGGPPKGAGVGAFALDRSFQNFSPSLEFGESYLDYRGAQFDVRVGLQKFFWGQLDSIQPNDLLSPREYEDPFLTDAADAKIAVPALAATYYPSVPGAVERWLEEPSFTLVWQPISVPWRYPLLGERWYPPTGTATPFVDIPASDDFPTCPCRIAIEQETVNSSAPARTFDNGNVALRLGATVAEVDWSVMFFDGYDTSPAFDVPIRLSLGGPGASGGIDGVADTQVRPAYRRFQAVGTDFALAVDRFTVRGEANWRFRRPYPMDLSDVAARVLESPEKRQALARGEQIVEPAFAQRDSLAWGLGVDTIVEGAHAILEVYELIILNNDQPLLVQNVDTRLSSSVTRSFLRERLEAEVIGVWGIESGYELVRATVGYDVFEGLELRLGLLGVWGRERSLIGQYKRNSELFGGVRYHF